MLQLKQTTTEFGLTPTEVTSIAREYNLNLVPGMPKSINSNSGITITKYPSGSGKIRKDV